MTGTHKEYDEEPKLLIIGDKRVGKSSLRNYLLGRPMKAGQYQSSVVDVMETQMDGKTIKIFDIQDIDTMKRNEDLQKLHLSNANGLLLMFAINDRSSFDAIPELLTMVIENNKKKLIPMAIVGNKKDLRIKGEDFISYQDASQYTNQISKWANIEIPYFDTSVKFETGMEGLRDFVVERKIVPLKT